MKILENNFAEVTFDSNIFKVNILDSYPTVEEWTDCKDALENFYQAIEIKQLNFTVIYDISNLGMLPYTYIKELTDIVVGGILSVFDFEIYFFLIVRCLGSFVGMALIGLISREKMGCQKKIYNF